MRTHGHGMGKARPESGRGVLRWVVLAALVATIPAFYAELLQAAPTAWSDLSYAAAALMVAFAQWRSGRWRLPPARQVVDLVLIAGLVLAALLPPSQSSPAALVLRLLVAFLSLARMVKMLQPWVTRGGTIYLMVVACGVLLLCGVGFWWLEPHAPTLADGLWLAFTTAATVGYGDIVPSTPASRIFSVFVVLLGYGVLTLATAAIATSWIETEERRIEREILGDLHRQVAALHDELAALRGELAGGAGRPPPR